MSEFRQHVGQEHTFEALGRTWKFGRWTLAVWREIVAWAKTVLPDLKAEGVALAKSLEGCPEAQKEVVQSVLDELRLPLGPNHPRIVALIDTMEGCVKVVHLLLKSGGTDASEEDAYELALSVGMAEAQKLAMKSAGIVAPKDEGAKAA